MLNVKLTFPYPEWPILRQTPQQSGIWGQCHFHINPPPSDRKYDYHFVFNYLLSDVEETWVSPRNIILITPEPATIEGYDKDYLRQFSRVITSQKWLCHCSKVYHQQGLPWFVEKSYDELISMSPYGKTKSISVIASNKLRTRGHKRRLDFAIGLKNHFKDKIDLFGRGVNPFELKWDTLAPYQYTIALENSRFPHYFTEKLSDAFLAFCYPIYFGAPNVGAYFDPRSYTSLRSLHLKKAILTIEAVLSTPDFYHNHLRHICEAREAVLNRHNLFAMIHDFVRSDESKGGIPVKVRLRNKISGQNWKQKILRRVL